MNLNSKKSKRQFKRIAKRLSHIDRKSLTTLDQMWDAWLQSDYANVIHPQDRANSYFDFRNIRKIVTSWLRQRH